MIGFLLTGKGFLGVGFGFDVDTGALPPIPKRDILAAPGLPIDLSICPAVYKPPATAAALAGTFGRLAALAALPGLACCTALACLICSPTRETLGVAALGGVFVGLGVVREPCSPDTR